MEAEEGIIIVTGKNIHIVSGIRYTKNFKRHHIVHGSGSVGTTAVMPHADALLEWKPLNIDETFHSNKAELQAAFDARKKAMAAPGSTLQAWWIEQIWVELLGVDTGYIVIALDEVRFFHPITVVQISI